MAFIFDSVAAARLVSDLTNCNMSSYVRCRPEDIKITGIGGGQTEVLGSIRLNSPFEYIRAWHAPQAIANILSASDIHTIYDYRANKCIIEYTCIHTIYDFRANKCILEYTCIQSPEYEIPRQNCP